MCCAERQLLQRVFTGVGATVIDAEAQALRAPLPVLVMPEQRPMQTISTEFPSYLSRACHELENTALSGVNQRSCHGQAVLGLAATWDMAIVGKPKLRTLDVSAVDGLAYRFIVADTEKSSLPR
jgi:flavoprotein